jgi:DNA-binding IclR family transcriptional regulator
MKDSNPNEKYQLQSVTNALRIIELLAEEGSLSSVSVGKALEIGKSTAFRLLSTLEMRNFVEKDDNNKYGLSTKFAYFGTKVLSRLEIISRARPFLEKLSQITNTDAHLVIWDENHFVRYIDKVGSTSLGVDSYVGMLRKSYATASGKVLLAYLPENDLNSYLVSEAFTPQTPFTIVNPEMLRKTLSVIKSEGVCISIDEDEIGFTCIAAPIFDKSGSVIAAVSISGVNSHMDTFCDRFKEIVVDMSLKISTVIQNGTL